MNRFFAICIIVTTFSASPIWGQELVSGTERVPGYWADFAWDGAAREWEFIDQSWRFERDGPRALLRLVDRQSSYQPPFRSPTHLALCHHLPPGDFQLDVRARSTTADYGHRDVCVFFGYQSPTQYYYAHLATQMDDRANQIFIVHDADRRKISESTSAGTPWDDDWHWIRVIRRVDSGRISVYFDDLNSPVMTAVDSTFGAGRVGIGSFDDTADFADLILKSLPSEKELGK